MPGLTWSYEYKTGCGQSQAAGLRSLPLGHGEPRAELALELVDGQVESPTQACSTESSAASILSTLDGMLVELVACGVFGP